MREDPSRENWAEFAATEGVVPFRRASASLHQPQDEQQEPSNSAAQFWTIVDLLLRRRWLILVILVTGVSVGAFLTLMRVPQFSASTTLEIQRQQTQIIEGADVEPLAVADAEHMSTQYELLKSRALAERVAEVLDLSSDPRFADPSAGPVERLKSAADSVQWNLEVLPVSRSRIVELRVRLPHAEETARIANAVAETFIEMNLERRYNTTAYARRFLEERLSTTKASLEAAERKLNDYARDKQIVDLSSAGGSEMGSSLDASSLMAINAALAQAQQSRITAELKFAEARDNPSTRQFLENDGITLLRTKRSELFSEYQENLAKFQPEWPDMKQLKARIEALDSEIESERSKFVGALEAEYKSAVAAEVALRERMGELRTDVQNLRDRSVDYNILDREADTLRSQYDALLARYKDVAIAAGVGASQVLIVDRAEVPRQPFEPNMRSQLRWAFVLSLALGIGIAILLEYLDDTIKTPEDVRLKLGLSILGVVPALKGKPDVAALLRDPMSALSEAFSSARIALQVSTIQGAPKSLLVTGIKPGEGKTTSSLALAVAFANTGARVLIVDADLRRPSFTASAKTSAGLVGYINQKVALRDHVVQGAIENVFLLPSGGIPPNPAELLSSPRVRQLLEEANGQFDMVIFDAPPILNFADAPSIASVCDGTVVVLQAGKVRRPAAIRAIDRLYDSNANVLGAVLTKFDVRRADYSYEYAYGDGRKTGGWNWYGTLSNEAKRRRRVEIFNSADDSGDSLQPQS